MGGFETPPLQNARSAPSGLRAPKRDRDGGERRLRLAAIGTAGLRHFGFPATAFPAQRLGSLSYQIHGGKTRREIRRNTNHHTGLAVGSLADNGYDARADVLLAFIGQAFQFLGFYAVHHTAKEFYTCYRSYPWWIAQMFRSSLWWNVLRSKSNTHCELLPRFRQIAFKAASLIEHLREPRRQFLDRRADFRRRRLGKLARMPQRLARRRAGESLDAPDPGADRAFGDHRNQPDIPGAAHVGAAAQLDRPAHGVAALAHGHHANLVAIFLTE